MPSEVVIFPPPHHAYGLILGDLTVDDLDRDGTREEGCRTSMTGGRSRKEICSTSATAGPRRTFPLIDTIAAFNQVKEFSYIYLVNPNNSDEEIARQSKNQTSDLPTSGLKFRSRKRVYLQQPGRVTRSKKSIAQPDASLTPEDVIFQHNDNIDMTTEGDSIPLPDEDTYMDTEGEERWERGVNMGHGLQRLTRARRGKLPVVLAEGMTTPVTLVIAAKFATE
ncbi:hypothetical protein GUJ93_ZPchr0004g39894 [Zizania palustris]|uniref:Uncharacterized protein n=1 Tax=Zizania palustris TaxID=103762 RepID=A0A8J5VNY6_ZIZPA|nr:hypothetical protein GUJ93_ZPchr0004g39894 [Zizania palustris]